MKLDKKDWQTVRFDEVVHQGKGTVDPETSGLERYIAGEHMNSEDLHLRQWGTVGEGYLGPAFHRHFEKGDILYGSRRTYLKKVAVADFEGITSNTTFVIKENTELVEPGLIPFLMLSDRFTENSVKNSKGSVNPYINFKDIGKFQFRLPSRAQQAQLVELLWAADEVNETYSVLRNELIGIQNILIEHHAGGKHSYRNLSEVIIQKKCVSNSPHELRKYVGLEQIEPGAFTCEKYIDSSLAIANCFEFVEGDVLYSKLRPYLDKAFLANFKGVCTTELLVLNTTDECLPEYLLLILHSADFIKYVNGKSFGTKMPRVSIEIVGEYLAHIPAVEMQQEIVAAMTKVHGELSKLGLASAANRATQQQLINQIFSA